MFFDPMYFLFIAPAFLLSLWASSRVKSSFKKWSKYATSGNYSGSDIARMILDNSGLHHIKIEKVSGTLTDHYDPTAKTLRLSDSTYDSRSIAAAGVAAHESGHAIQDKTNYPLLGLRSSIVPVTGFASNFSWILITIGFFLMYAGSNMGSVMTLAGIILFSIIVVFQLITVPVEIDASNRAKQILIELKFSSKDEIQAVNEVLNAAAWTYVAAAASSIMTLLYFLLRFSSMSDD